MGYCTCYSLQAETYPGKKELSLEMIEKIDSKLKEMDVLDYALYRYRNDMSFWNPADSVKWYDHSEHMVKLSEEFPGILFTLHGQGEEAEDLWNKYYFNGTEQIAGAEIIYPPFDPSKIIDPTVI